MMCESYFYLIFSNSLLIWMISISLIFVWTFIVVLCLLISLDRLNFFFIHINCPLFCVNSSLNDLIFYPVSLISFTSRLCRFLPLISPLHFSVSFISLYQFIHKLTSRLPVSYSVSV